MILNFVTFSNHFNGSLIPLIDLSNMQTQLVTKIEGLIQSLQSTYIEKVITHSIATNNFYPQLTPTTPQNSTLTHWISIEQDFRECLVYFLYCDIMQYLKTNESGLGANMGLANYDKSFLVTYYNKAIDIAKQVRKTVFSNSVYGSVACTCEIKLLQYYPF